MKYRVVGWTDYESDEVPESNGSIGFAERNAIIDDIRKNGYRFSGWDHQETWDCVPVLNDGKKRLFTQRGWGGLMAEAYGQLGSHDYAAFTFHSMKNRKLPNDSFDIAEFTPETDLNEHFEIEVDEGIFALSQTRNPFFLDDLDELRYLDAGDTLTLRCGERSARFLIYDINRNRNTGKKSSEYTINTKFKIVVTHKMLEISE